MPTKQTRKNQLVQIRKIIADLEARLQTEIRSRNHLNLLKSVSLGLYEEIDKLSKKAPAEAVTDLVLTQMNEVIRETKELVTDDSFVQRLQEFVPAGDNPQHRDAVVVMRQIRQGLERFDTQLDILIKRLKSRLTEAKAMEMAIQLYLDGNEFVTSKDLKINELEVPKTWTTGLLNDDEFIFNKLDQIDINTYFEIAND